MRLIHMALRTDRLSLMENDIILRSGLWHEGGSDVMLALGALGSVGFRDKSISVSSVQSAGLRR